MSFIVYPAIDVRGGKVVRLRQGDYAEETRYADDPLAIALDGAYDRLGAIDDVENQISRFFPHPRARVEVSRQLLDQFEIPTR